jgi:hypothetical protein
MSRQGDKMKQSSSFYVLILAVGLFILGGAFAGDACAANENPCSADVARFCGNIAPGPAGMITLMDCLEEHEKELSTQCRDFEATMGGPRTERRESVREKKEFRDRCIGDMAKFCQDASPTQGGMMKCLDEHENALSDPCRQSIKAMK